MEKMGCGMTSCGRLKKAHKKSYFVQSIGKHFFIPKEYEGKKVFLIFDGIYRDSHFYLNEFGELLGASNGNPTDHTPGKAGFVNTFHGLAQIIVRRK